SHESCPTEHREVMRYGRRSQLEERRELLNGARTLRQKTDDFQPVFIGEGFEEGQYVCRYFFLCHEISIFISTNIEIIRQICKSHLANMGSENGGCGKLPRTFHW